MGWWCRAGQREGDSRPDQGRGKGIAEQGKAGQGRGRGIAGQCRAGQVVKQEGGSTRTSRGCTEGPAGSILSPCLFIVFYDSRTSRDFIFLIFKGFKTNNSNNKIITFKDNYFLFRLKLREKHRTIHK